VDDAASPPAALSVSRRRSSSMYQNATTSTGAGDGRAAGRDSDAVDGTASADVVLGQRRDANPAPLNIQLSYRTFCNIVDAAAPTPPHAYRATHAPNLRAGKRNNTYRRSNRRRCMTCAHLLALAYTRNAQENHACSATSAMSAVPLALTRLPCLCLAAFASLLR